MNTFQTVKELVSFEDVVRHYGIEFKRGKSLCPFHDEKTPSFSLHPSREYAKCFGCGEVSDAIELEFKLGRHSSRWEAVKTLNERYHLGIKFNGFDKEKAEEFNNASRLLDRYCEQTHKALLQNKEALTWLEEKKGIIIEDVKEYRIGYVGNGWLRDEAKDRSRAIAIKLGLLKEKEKDGKIYDAFCHRLIFPVWQRGRIVSIWTREFPDKENSNYKWLGLPNSELIPNKPIAWIENLNCDTCIAVEGITDAMAFLKAGILACALLGKEVSEANKFYFEKAKAKLYLALDPDEAGREASYKLAKEIKGYTIDLGFDKKDPDEVLAGIGVKEFKKLTEKGIGEARYYLDLMIERESIEEVLKEILNIGNGFYQRCLAQRTCRTP